MIGQWLVFQVSCFFVLLFWRVDWADSQLDVTTLIPCGNVGFPASGSG